jgi:20S proteasome alpha/beta subunit
MGSKPAVAGTSPHVVLSDETLRKMRRMTLIVGAVGKDGIVLAADINAVEFSETDGIFDDVMGIAKIDHLAVHHVAVGFAGDGISERFGSRLRAFLDRNASAPFDIKTSLEAVATESMTSVSSGGNARLPRRILAVFYGEQVGEHPQLWWVDLKPAGTSDVRRIKDMAVVGAQGNPARFFRKYYDSSAPITKLAQLSAHIVLAGHKWDNLINGLEVALISRQSGYRELSESEKEEIKANYKKLDNSMTCLFS